MKRCLTIGALRKVERKREERKTFYPHRVSNRVVPDKPRGPTRQERSVAELTARMWPPELKALVEKDL